MMYYPDKRFLHIMWPKGGYLQTFMFLHDYNQQACFTFMSYFSLIFTVHFLTIRLFHLPHHSNDNVKSVQCWGRKQGKDVHTCTSGLLIQVRQRYQWCT